MNSLPLVSIITPTFNLGAYIEETIRSVQSQTYKNWEMIIGDDGSNDDTCDVAECVAAEDKRINVHRFPHGGLPSLSRNRALSVARGDVIAFLDGDDLWEPNKLETQIRNLQQTNSSWGFANSRHFGEHDSINYPPRWKPSSPFFSELLAGSGIPCLTIIVKRELLERVCVDGDLTKAFDEADRFKAVEDWDLALRLARESEPCYDSAPIARYRVHPGGISRSFEKNNQAARSIIEKYRSLGVDPSLVEQAIDVQRSKLAMNNLLLTDEPWRKELWCSCARHPFSLRNLSLAGMSLLPRFAARKMINLLLDIKHQRNVQYG